MTEEQTSKKNNIWAYALIAAAGLGMLLFDVNPFAQNDHPTVARVGDRDISTRELHNATVNLQNQFPNLDRALVQQQALNQLLRQTLLEQHALESDFTYPDSALRQDILNQFGDNTAYEQWLRDNNLSAKNYQENLRQSQSIRHYYQTLAATAPAQSPLFDNLLAAFAQQHDYSVIRLAHDSLAQSLEADPAAIRAHYDAHPEQFLTPERVSIRYFILDSATLADPEALAKLGEQRAGQYLIFDDKTAADNAAQAIMNGDKTFADIAAAINSGTIPGESGDLPLQLHGKGVDPIVDDALFALAQEGDTSPVLTSDNFNAMLITLSERKPADDNTKAALAREAGAARYADIAEKAFDAALNNKPLQQIADLAGQTLHTLDNLTPDTTTDWTTNAKIQQSLFGERATAIGSIAEPVELAPGQSVFYDITARTLPETQPYDNIAQQVETAWRNAETAKILDQRAAALADAWQNGNPDTLIAEYAGVRQQYQSVNHLFPPENLSPDLARNLLAQTGRINTAIADNGDRLITHLDQTRPGDTSQLPEDIRTLLHNQWQLATTQTDEDAMARWLEQSGQIKLHPENLPQP
ncbi:MAG: peptidylprolyl isomerase [Cardiobacteriaceae bacterium]|nr:peptidylprolyl isomerase [Cardiobacteriaceae bacterium]